MTKLEERILFSASPLAELVESPSIEQVAPESTQTIEASDEQSREIIFVDSGVDNFQTLIDGVGPDVEVVVLDAHSNGLLQIQNHLSGRTDLNAIHLLSHGTEGHLQLGNATISIEQMQATYESVLSEIGSSFSPDGDLLIYGCDFGGGQDGQKAVDQLAKLVGSDVAASNDLTGNSQLGGDWDLEIRSGQIETDVVVTQSSQSHFRGVLGGAIPTVSPNVPAEVFINEEFQFTATFSNTSSTSTDVGYAPFMELTVEPGVELSSAEYLGSSVTLIEAGTFDSMGNLVDSMGDPVTHPITGELVTGGTEGEILYVVELPFGSFVPGQPPAEITFTATLDEAEGAVVGQPLDIDFVGGFALGCDPLDNPGTDPVVYGTTTTQSVTPTVIQLTKEANIGEDERSTGPNFPITYSLTVDIADGETISFLDITDSLPNSFVYVDGSLIVDASAATSATVAIETDSPTAGSPQNSPNNDFLIEFDSVTGSSSDSDIVVQYTVWISELDADGIPVIDPITGDSVVANNDASVSGTHSTGVVGDNDASTDEQISQNSISIQKGVQIVNDVGGAGATPGDTLEYTLQIQISDFFEFSNVIIDDTFSDGQLFDGTFGPTFAISEGGTTNNGSFDPGNFTVTHNVGVDGTTDVFFDVSAEDLDGLLTGDLVDGMADGATTVTVTFRTVIQESFTDDFPSSDPSVDTGDVLTNNVTVTGTLPSGQTESDSSSASVEISGPAVQKTVYAINGDTGQAGNNIIASNTITYRITFQMATADFENLVITDFLPLPVYDATEITNLITTPSATPPAAGSVSYGDTHDLHVVAGVTPSLSTNAASNSVVLDFGDFDVDPSTPATIDLLITVTAQDVLFDDGLFLTNQVNVSYGSTSNSTVSSEDIAQNQLSAPELILSKGIVSTDAVSPTFDPTTVGPVTFAAPDSVGASFAGGINSSNLATSPINSNLIDADAGDLVKFALVIENTGSADGYNLVITDALPGSFFLVPGSGLNLEVRDGDGNLLTFSGTDTDLFTTGIEIDDPSATQGAINNFEDATAMGDGSNIIVVTYDLELAVAITPDTTYTNTAEIAEFGAVDGGNDHTAGSSNSDWTDDATVETLNFAATKSIVETSEAHTGFVSGFERVTIGEIVRYRLVAELPEGTVNDFVLRDLLPNGLLFLNDGTSTVAIVSNGGGVTSSATGALGVNVASGGFVSGNETNVGSITPSFALSDNNIGSTANSDANVDSYTSGSDVYFKLGTIENADNDADSEFIVVEFNALVLNNPSNATNGNGNQRSNSFRIQDGTSSFVESVDATVAITEPLINNVDKTAAPTTGDAGDTVLFTITFSPSNNANRTDAFDVRIFDVLNSDFTLSVPSINVMLSGGASGLTNSSAGNTIDLTIDELPQGSSVTITYEAVLNVDVQPGEDFTNTVNVTYTSLPGAGTAANPTGSTTPGASGDDDGERDGSGVGDYNDYTDTDTATLTVISPGITKSLVSSSIVNADNSNTQVVIGETVQYEIQITIPEGTTDSASIVDTLDFGLGFVSLDSIVTSSGVTSDTVDLNDSASITPSVSGQEVTFNLGTITNANSSGAAETITIRYTAVVQNVTGNQGENTGTILDNVAYFAWIVGTTNMQTSDADAEDVEVIEAKLDILKSVNTSTADAGDTLTYTILISHNVLSDTTAYDIALQDVLPSDLTFVSLSATHSSLGDVSGNFQHSTGTISTVAGGFDLAVGDTVTLTVNATISSSVTPNQEIENSAAITWTSIDGTDSGERDGSDGEGGLLDDFANSSSAATTISLPTPSKTVISSSVISANNAVDELVIGETATFQVAVNIPEGVVPASMIIDDLDLGLQFVSLDSVTATSGGVTTAQVTSSVGAFSNTALFNPTVTGDGTTTAQRLSFDFGSLTNTNSDNVSVEQIVVTYTVRAVNVVTNQALLDLENTAFFQWEQGGSTVQSNTSTETVTILEPNLDVDKSVSGSSFDSGDTITYTIEIDHNALSDADAFDVEFVDVVPSEIDFTIGNVTVTHSSLGNITSLFEISGNTLRTIAGSSFDLALGQTVTVTIEGTVNATLEASETVSNSASITWSSLDGDDANERDGDDGPGGALNDYSESSSTDFDAPDPAISKSLISTSINSTNNANDEVVIGELVTYSITVTIPEGTTSDVLLTDSLDLGLVFVSLDSVVTNSAGSTTTDITSSIGAISVANFSPTVTGDGLATPQSLEFDLGTLSNSNTNNANVETVVLTYSVRVANIATNQSNGSSAGTMLGNSVTMEFSVDSVTQALPIQNAADIEVIEPEIVVAKSISDDTPHLGQEVTYTISLQHTSNSDADANNVRVLDTLPTGLTLDLSSISVVGATVSNDLSSGNNIDLQLEQIALGTSVTITYDATVTSDATAIGQSLNNTASITWTSLPDGDFSGTNDDERDGDGGNGGEDSYADSSAESALVTHPRVELTKTQIGPVVAATSGIEGNLQVTYDLTITSTGNDPLTQMSLVEDLRTQYGNAFVSLVLQSGQPVSITNSTATDVPELNSGYDGGISDSEIFDNSGGNTNLLANGESITIRLIVEIDPDASGAVYDANGNLVNQATVSGTGDDTGFVVDDDSDDPTNLLNDDPDMDGNPDDANLLRIPLISLDKQITSGPSSASSGINGNYEVTYQLTVTNTGTASLDMLSLTEDFATNFGGAFVQLVGSPTIFSSTASDNPEINSSYDGGLSDAQIFDNTGGNTNELRVGESVTIEVTVEVDPDSATANLDSISSDGTGDFENQATVTGFDGAVSVSDTSDDPSDTTEFDNNSDNDPDDPTTFSVSDITLNKTLIGVPVVATSGVEGNFEVTYDLQFINTGNEVLSAVSLIEDLATQYGNAFVRIVDQGGMVATITASTATDAIEINGAYDGGTTNSQLIDNSGGNTNALAAGESVTIRLVIEVDPDATGAVYDGSGNLSNQATVIANASGGGTVTDESDDTTDSTNLDGDNDNDPNDPSLFRIPLVSLDKSITSGPSPAASGVNGNYDVTYQLVITNTGTTSLDMLTLTEDFSSNFGGAFVGLVSPPTISVSTASDNPEINSGYDGGLTDSQLFDNAGGNTNLLDVGESVTVTVTVEIDPNSATALTDSITGDGNNDFENQAMVSGNDGAITVSDNSDDPADTIEFDSNSDNDPDDVTTFSIADITLNKTLVGSPSAAASGIEGNFDVTYDLQVINQGNESLDSLSLIEDLSTQYGSAFVRIVSQAGSPASIVSSTATDAVEINANYDGGATDNQLVDNTGGNVNLLEAGQSITIRIVIELDPDALGANRDANGNFANQATVTGTALDGAMVTDSSDDTGDTTDLDGDGDNDPADPSLIRIPLISATKQITGGPTPAASGINGNYDITYAIEIINTGSTSLDMLTLTEDFAANFGDAFVQLIAVPNISASSATDIPEINGNYDGGVTDAQIFDNSSGQTNLLEVGQSITVVISIEVDPNAATATTDAISSDGNNDFENQVTVTGRDFDSGSIVEDTSDESTDANNVDNDSDNDPDDLTVFSIADISLLKNQIGSAVPASSGTVGNWEVTFDLEILNQGNEDLDSLSLIEDLRAQYGNAFVAIVPQSGSPAIVTSSTASDSLEINSGYDGGITDSQLIDNTGLATNRLQAGESVTVRIVIEIDPDAAGAIYDGSGNLSNSASVSGMNPMGVVVDDLSDDPTNGADTDSNGDNDPEDANLLRIPAISLTKQVISTADASSGIFGNHDITYQFEISNVGTTELDQLILTDNWAGQFGSAFVRIVPGTLSISNIDATVLPGINTSYSGLAAENLLDGTGMLNPGESFTVTIVVEVDPNAAGALITDGDLVNQASISSEDAQSPTNDLVQDLSDDPSDATNLDPNFDSNPDDPTRVSFSDIGLAKRVVLSEPAVTPGNFNLTYELRMRNLGSTDLSNLSLQDDLAGLLGPGFLGLTVDPFIVSSTALSAPNLNPNFDGNADIEIFDGVSGLLRPGDEIVIQFVVEMDIDQLTSTSHNQAVVAGNDGSQTVMDLSDAGSDPEGTNPDTVGDTGGEDDITLLPAIGISKVHSTPVPTGPNLQEWAVEFTLQITNLGFTDLTNLTLSEDIASQFGPAFVETGLPVIDATGIVSGTAPGVNANWINDTSQNMLDGTGTLQSGDSFSVSFVVIIDPDAEGASEALTNQAVVSATDPNNPSVNVTDASDSGTSPSSNNSGAPGDTGLTEDATPLQIPDISLAKQFVDSQQVGATFDATFELTIENVGTVDLSGIQLFDDLAVQFQPHTTIAVGIPVIVSSTASIDPIVNNAWGSDLSSNVFVDGTGLLKPGESITVQVVVNIAPDFTALDNGKLSLENQAQTFGTPVDVTGNPLTDFDGNVIPSVSDLSDDGTDTNGSNPGSPGDRGTWDDATPAEIDVFAFDAFNNAAILAEDLDKEIFDPVHRPFPIDTVYSGLTEPGSTLRFTLVDQDGLELGQRTVVADAAGNWLITFPGTVVGQQPHDMIVEQTPAVQNNVDEAGFNLRRYFHPAVHHSLFVNEPLNIRTIVRNLPHTVINTMHQANLNPLGLAWNSHPYELASGSSNTASR
ncbi:MAG: isopeptide-forming domain-containing fimbrial protein [Planctomycetota bacterium]